MEPNWPASLVMVLITLPASSVATVKTEPPIEVTAEPNSPASWVIVLRTLPAPFVATVKTLPPIEVMTEPMSPAPSVIWEVLACVVRVEGVGMYLAAYRFCSTDDVTAD